MLVWERCCWANGGNWPKVFFVGILRGIDVTCSDFDTLAIFGICPIVWTLHDFKYVLNLLGGTVIQELIGHHGLINRCGEVIGSHCKIHGI